jgi:Flp pilus assembly protein TadB
MVNVVRNVNTGKIVARFHVQPSAAIYSEDMQAINLVNRNHEIRLLQDRLDAIKAKRQKGGFIVQIMRKLRRVSRSRRNMRLQKKSASR